MREQIIIYLEEYARRQRIEFDSLMDRAVHDGDKQAAHDSEVIYEKIQNIKRIISQLRREKAGDGNRTHVSALEGPHSTIEPHPRN